MLFRRLQKNIVNAPHFARRFFHNVANRKNDLAQYQFTSDVFWTSRGMAKPKFQFRTNKTWKKHTKKRNQRRNKFPFFLLVLGFHRTVDPRDIKSLALF